MYIFDKTWFWKNLASKNSCRYDQDLSFYKQDFQNKSLTNILCHNEAKLWSLVQHISCTKVN